MMTNTSRILVADDDLAMRQLLVSWLRGAGYSVTECTDGLDLLARLQKSVLSGEIAEFDLVLSDIWMPFATALDVLDEFLGCEGVPPTILITAFANRDTYALADHLGAAAVLEKPFAKAKLMDEIRCVCASARGPRRPGADGSGKEGS
jgi:two-component system response regulator PilR (NtrC family)